MTTKNTPGNIDYYLQQMIFYVEQINAILTELDTVMPDPLKRRIYELKGKIESDIRIRIKESQTPAPRDFNDY